MKGTPLSFWKSNFLALLFFLFSPSTHAQLTVNSGTGLSASTIVSSLIGAGVSVSNITEDCNPASRGTFTASGAAATGLQMTGGVIITNGKAVSVKAMGGNGSCCEEAIENMQGATSEGDLQTLVPGKSLHDVCKIEFDLQVTGDSLYIEYVFGSEEHPKWAPPLHTEGDYNDVFGFFISGPGITGVQNIAKVPGTTDDVSVLTVNTVTNPLYFVENYSTQGCTITGGCGSNTSPFEFNGYTKKMTAKIKIIDGAAYHVKLAIADVGDYILNSGTFIKAGSIAGIGAVPVTLIHFKAHTETHSVELDWSTATESNNSHFEILRSSDAVNYQSIAKVYGMGNSSESQEYRFMDQHPLTGINYYRLKQVDFNGASVLSYIVSVIHTLSLAVDVYPNPVQGWLSTSVMMPCGGELIAEIADFKGSVIILKSFKLNQGMNTISMDTDQLEQGSYTLRLSGEAFGPIIKRIVK